MALRPLLAPGSAPRESPVARVLYEGTAPLTALHGMPARLESDADPSPLPVGIADASSLSRFGVKGPDAQRFLEACGLELPAGVNCYLRADSGDLTARLGRAEFFLEDAPNGGRLVALREVALPSLGVYPVPRQDAAFVLFGARAEQVLAQTTSFDFRNLCREPRAAVLTLMAGVSVLLLGYEVGGVPRYRIWCDPSFGPYLCRTLLGIVEEEGGRATGLFTALGLSLERGASSEAAPDERSLL